MRKARFSLGRTVQLIDYKDSLRYGVDIEVTQEAGEPDAAFLARAGNEAKAAFNNLETQMLEASYAAYEATNKVPTKMPPVNVPPETPPSRARPLGPRRRPTT